VSTYTDTEEVTVVVTVENADIDSRRQSFRNGKTDGEGEADGHKHGEDEQHKRTGGCHCEATNVSLLTRENTPSKTYSG
jgi:hypothetical protein